MDGSVVVDGEASETESEYSDSEEEFSECVEGTQQPPSPTTATLTPATPELDNVTASQPPPLSSSQTPPSSSQPPPSSSQPPPPPSPGSSLTLFEENLRERNAVFSNQLTALVNGYSDRVITRLKFLNLDCKNLQISLEKLTYESQNTKGNLNRGINQLDSILAFNILPERWTCESDVFKFDDV